MNSQYFTVKEILQMDLPGMPKTSAGIHQKINREVWPHELRGGRGGKAGGTREYTPPPEVMALIEARRRGEIGDGDERGGYVADKATGVKRYFAEKTTSSDEVVAKEDDSIKVKPPVIDGAALKCPGCGEFTGFIKPEGRVRLEFDVPDPITFMHVALALKPGYKEEDVDAVLALTYRAFSVLSLITAGNQEGISNLLSKPTLVKALAVFCEELNANPTHDHLPPDT